MPTPISRLAAKSPPRMARTRGPGKGRWHALAHLPLRVLPLIRGSLRAKFILIIVSLEIFLMGTVIFVVERHQRSAILEQTRLRALSVATSLVALSEGYLITYDFAKLEQAAEKVTADDPDVIYTVVHLRDGRVAAFSEDRRVVTPGAWGDRQGKMLTDPTSQRALQADAPLLQQIMLPQTRVPGYDVAIPVYAAQGSQKWGTVRLGFSLQRANTAIQHTRRDLFLLSLGAIVCGILLATFLSMRISKPIGQLVATVQEIAEGSYDHAINIAGRDEIGYLARAFEQMRVSLQIHLTGLAEEKNLLQESNLRLEEAQQQLMHVAARVAHEVNNPLGIMKTAIRLLRDEGMDDAPSQELLEIMEAEIGRIARITREILVYTRPKAPEEMVEVSAVVHSLESVLAPSLQQKGIALKMILEPELPPVWISSDHLKQVILNLLRNAEDAMPEGGQLVIQTARTPEGVQLSMTDTGCGISEEDLSCLFDPFFSTKERGPEGGTGLGLAVSLGIIRNARGSIEVESELDKGSTFRVNLPACEV